MSCPKVLITLRVMSASAVQADAQPALLPGPAQQIVAGEQVKSLVSANSPRPIRKVELLKLKPGDDLCGSELVAASTMYGVLST